MRWDLPPVYVAAVIALPAVVSSAPDSSHVHNANHIFNAIHSSMRQWGSSVNHNGMSAFLATVPAGTLLYHGTPLADPVTGMEWLAFEPQHAFEFARIRVAPGMTPPIPKDEFVAAQQDAQSALITPSQESANDNSLRSLSWPRELYFDVPGYLHTYKAKHDLRLLYLDGSAAAKSRLGTTDFTDFVLLNNNTLRTGLGDLWRAQQLCEIAERKWHGHIEGFIRMECGFEIIMCSFGRSMDFIGEQVPFDIYQTGSRARVDDVFQWLQAAAKRFDGIGGSPSRVSLNYDNFVSAYATSTNISFQQPGNLPRLDFDDDKDSIAEARQLVTDMVLRDMNEPKAQKKSKNVNWQPTADLVVTEFADRLQYLTNTHRIITSGIKMAQELTFILRPYINTAEKDNRRNIARCVERFVSPPSQQSERGRFRGSLAHRAIYEVTEKICSTLHELLMSLPSPNADDNDDLIPREQVDKLNALMSYLAWPEWKRCRGCGIGEICMIPMFPFGSVQDYENPTCKSADSLGNIFGYWIQDST